jgi:hypothetical protein
MKSIHLDIMDYVLPNTCTDSVGLGRGGVVVGTFGLVRVFFYGCYHNEHV